MDNLTHSLAGAALAEIALPSGAGPSTRRLFLAAGVVASNLPDVDLVYTGITPAPLGYLLHHRGHTHTLLGLAVQGAALAALLLLVPALRRLIDGAPARFWALVGVGLLGHLAMDAWNSYGIHPFHPLDSSWYYGDAVFILEPWLWVLLGAAAAANARGRTARVLLVLLATLPPLGLLALGILPGRPLLVIALGGLAFAWATRRLAPSARAVSALAASLVLGGALVGLSRAARREVAAEFSPQRRGEVVDVVLSANPGTLTCWAVIVVERLDRDDAYALHRGTLSLVPRWQPPRDCASYRFARPGDGGRDGRRLAWNERIQTPLGTLRDLSARDCWTRAWLQFGRAPYLEGGVIRDLRFDRGGGGGNFTAMRVAAPGDTRPCPPNMTSWSAPRADLLGGGP